MTMKNDIKKAISENLPQTVGEELRKRLDQADEDAEALKISEKTNEAQQESKTTEEINPRA